MPEPDFDQIARRLDREFRTLIQSQESDQSVDLIAIRLKEVWNARGAADAAAVAENLELHRCPDAGLVKVLDLAINCLDR